MTWFAWRQFRIPTWITGAALVVVAALLAYTGNTLGHQWSSTGAAACHNDCRNALEAFIAQATNGIDGIAYIATAIVLYVAPALIGMFWGAPLLARELESGTYRLAWNQSISRTRWLATKLAVVGGASALAVGLLSLGVTAWGHHLDHVRYYRIDPVLFGARGIVPIGYALFAFALGVTMGMLIRRTVPAMAATLAVYLGALVSMPLWVRSRLVPAVQSISPLDLHRIDNLFQSTNGFIQVRSGVVPNGAWILVNNSITSSGKVWHGPASPTYCGGNTGPDTCLQWIGTLGLRQQLAYQPASHFWPLQWAETGVFVAAAALLTAFCFWWIRHRLV